VAGYQLSAALLAAGTPIPLGFSLGPVIKGSLTDVTVTPGYFALYRSPAKVESFSSRLGSMFVNRTLE